MGFLFGIPKKLIKRITEIEIDTHYYDTDVVPSNQSLFTYEIDAENKTAIITGLTDEGKRRNSLVIPYRIKYGHDTSPLYANVIALKDNCFKNNSNLKDIVIPNTIHEIPKGAFQDCINLNKVTIPKSINHIYEYAFDNCYSLGGLLIPYQVDIIEENAFNNCLLNDSNFNIICYKNSPAESFAIANNIPYSLISYRTGIIEENSDNLVTSHDIWSAFKHIHDRLIIAKNELTDKINTAVLNLTNHINGVDEKLTNSINNTNINLNALNDDLNEHISNKINPHDDSSFTNTSLNGVTNINEGLLTNVSDNDLSLVNKKYLKDAIQSIDVNVDGLDISGLQKVYDSNLITTNKTIVGAINESVNRIHSISGKLLAGWNTVSLDYLYPIGWSFLDKPYCYTENGVSVDFRVKELQPTEFNIINNSNTFNMYVPIACNYSLSTVENNIISGFPIDYLVISYYYTGNDGTDLDTVTEITNPNWPTTIRKNIGYGYNPDRPITFNNMELIKFSGDNTGGGIAHANDKFYECVYFNIKAIQEILTDEDIEIILYASWYKSRGNGHINISLQAYANEKTPTVVDLGNTFAVKVDDVELNPTYKNVSEIECYIESFSNSNKSYSENYTTKYTPAFKIIFHKTTNDSNYRTVTIVPLS